MSKVIETKEEFNAEVLRITSKSGYRKPIMFGICRNDMGVINTEAVLQSNFMVVNVGENMDTAAIFAESLIQDPSDEAKPTNIVHVGPGEAVYHVDNEFIQKAIDLFRPYHDEAISDKHLNIQALAALGSVSNMFNTNDIPDGQVFGKGNYTYSVVFIYDDLPVETVEAGYLKLYALSQGKSPIRSLNLDGLFGRLTNCAWTSNGEPIELDLLESKAMELKAFGQYPNIVAVDKFPRMLQHVIPDHNTRILDSSKVRMGAQLAAGTTVMPGASYINFNAGTLGSVMVEGRISSSAIVGAGSDIGGGASILGVLSGTDGDPITIGEKCLLGANSTIGICLGDGCIVDAGVAILSGTKITIKPEEQCEIETVNDDPKLFGEKLEFNGSELSGLNGIHFRRDSITGQIIAKRSSREVVLNKELH